MSKCFFASLLISLFFSPTIRIAAEEIGTYKKVNILKTDTVIGKSKITEVTVFLNGAQITRTSKIDVPAGNICIALKNLSPHIDASSIKVKTTDKSTILLVNHRINYLNEKKKIKLISYKEQLEDTLMRLETELNILNNKESFLQENKAIKGSHTGIQLMELKEVYSFYGDNLKKIQLAKIATNKQLAEVKEKIRAVEKQIKELQNSAKNTAGEIYVKLNTESKTVNLLFSYLCKNAGWFPAYDIRVKDITQPVNLTYLANVYQNTGEDWNNVNLIFSNANPTTENSSPSLSPYYLNYGLRSHYYAVPEQNYSYNPIIRNVSGIVTDEFGEPLPGVSIKVKNHTIGTVTDANGAYSLVIPPGATHLVCSFIGFETQTIPIHQNKIDIQLLNNAGLEEVVVTAMGSRRVLSSLSGKLRGIAIADKKRERLEEKKEDLSMVMENETTVEFKVKVPYSISSNGENYKIELSQSQIPAEYEYFCIPKIEQEAYLMAKIINWDEYNLLEGEANLYFENTYVGKSILGVKYLTDTLRLSLGKDKNVLVKREKVKEYTKKRFIGTNRVAMRSYKIGVRNSKAQAIKITIQDQIPVSENKEITVEGLALSQGKLNTETGMVSWEIPLNANTQEEKILKYEVKYPKNKMLLVE